MQTPCTTPLPISLLNPFSTVSAQTRNLLRLPVHSNQTQSCPHPVSCFYSTTIWSVFDPGPDSLRLKIISHRSAIPAAQVTVYPYTFNYVTTRLCSVSIYVWSSYHVARYSSICCARKINQSKLSISDWFNFNRSSHVFVINYWKRNLALNLPSKFYMLHVKRTVESYETIFTVAWRYVPLKVTPTNWCHVLNNNVQTRAFI